MTQRKHPAPGGEEEESLKQELRNLPHVSAPWYLESDVLRRLRSGETRKSWIAHPVPAVAVSLLGVAILGGVSYFLYFGLLSGTQEAPPNELRTLPAAVPTPQAQPERSPGEAPQRVLPSANGSPTIRTRTGATAPQSGARTREVLNVRPSQEATEAESSSTVALPTNRPPAPATSTRKDSLGTRDTGSSRHEPVPVAPLNPARRDTTH